MLGMSLHAWGYVDEATGIKERLASSYPDAKGVARLERLFSKPAGSPPDEKVFMRPYRIHGVSPLTGQAY
jgi:hypothetical protein